jgi:hypothetical protein
MSNPTGLRCPGCGMRSGDPCAARFVLCPACPTPRGFAPRQPPPELQEAFLYATGEAKDKLIAGLAGCIMCWDCFISEFHPHSTSQPVTPEMLAMEIARGV